MIYVKLVAVCDTSGCETTQEYVVGIHLFSTDSDDLDVATLPDNWEWAFDEPHGCRALCPKCLEERKK